MTETKRSEDPEGALEKVQQTLFGPVPVKGNRQESLIKLAHWAAEAGQTNDWILNTLMVACDLWGKYPRTFDRWTRLLNILRMVRKTYPNQPDGSGWVPGFDREEEVGTR